MNKVFHHFNNSCPSCESGEVETRLVDDDFQYGDGAEAVMLHVTLPLRECKKCGLEYLDEEAEQIRHDAVCKHLRILTPREITAIRQRYGMNKIEFSGLTGVGRVSLGRWESGALLQNSSVDNLIYLMGFPENVSYLQQRGLETQPENTERKTTRKFRSLSVEQISAAGRQSDNFSLHASCH